MVSFITLSRDAARLRALHDSLGEAFGVAGESRGFPWELIPVDGEQYDLFSGYDRGAAVARHENLVFLHDDVRLLGNAGMLKQPLSLLAKPFTGFIGAAGATEMNATGCWWRADHTLLRGAVAHPGSGPFGIHWNVWPFQAGQFGRVAVCDGLFLMTTKTHLARVGGFDRGYLKGFHFYDLCVTLRSALAGFVNYVAPLPLLHLSHGETNDGWEENRKAFVTRYGGRLPFGVGG